jgi:tripartite-type tricarboxylate transporter receptor subunit TctC
MKRSTSSLLVLLVALVVTQVQAQTFPSKTVHAVVPYAVGGTVDLQARIYSDKLSRLWNVPVVVENRAGANGNIGTDYLARAAADGHTFGVIASQHAMAPALFAKLPFALSDFKAISVTAQTRMALLVRSDFPANTVAELIAYAKANSGKVTAGIAGPATANNIWLKMFEKSTGTRMLAVPYRGSGPAHIELMAGRLDIMFDAPGAVLQHIQAGRIKVLAVGGSGRADILPAVPSLDEAGYPAGKLMASWTVVLVPSKTPPEIIDKLGRDFIAVLKDPDVKQRLAAAGLEVLAWEPGEADRHVFREADRLTQLIREHNIVVE